MLDNLQPHNDMIVGTAVQDQFLRSTQKGDLRIPTKSGEIIIPGYVFQENTLDHNLAGLFPLCNAGCTVTLTATAITVDKDGEILFHNSKLPTDALWCLDFTNTFSACTNLDIISQVKQFFCKSLEMTDLGPVSVRINHDEVSIQQQRADIQPRH